MPSEFSATLETFVPSVIIALTTVMVFVAARLIARFTRRFRRAALVSVTCLALLFSVWVFVSRSSRWALLLPAAAVLGLATATDDDELRLFR